MSTLGIQSRAQEAEGKTPIFVKFDSCMNDNVVCVYVLYRTHEGCVSVVL